MLLKCMFLFCVVAVSIRNVQAVSSEEKQKFHADVSPPIVQCSQESGLTMDDIKKMKESDTYDTLDPCVMKCIFDKSHLIDDQGLFDADKAVEFIKKYLSDETDLTKAIEIISNCKAVNLRDVTDGKKGCERARFIFECFRNLKAMFAN